MTPRLPEPLTAMARLLPAPVYVVGGYVRNSLLYGSPKSTDVDVCGPMTVDELTKALEGTDAKLVPVNPRVGTVLLLYQGGKYEYTTFRRDSYPIGGVHTPESVTFVRTVAEDAMRRDFRVNALYIDVATGEVIDPTGGLQDLRNHVVSTTREPEQVFGEDGLRILRMVRFCAELGFTPHADTLRVAKNMRAQLEDISPERKREELDKILLSDQKYGVANGPQRGVALLNELGLWPFLCMQGVRTLRPIFASPKLETRLAALCHAAADLFAYAFAGLVLGKDGLRYANKQVECVKRLLAGMDLPLTLEDRYLWAVHFGDEAEEIFALWQDRDKESDARLAIAAVQRAGVPRSHKDLPLTPAEIEALGVPKDALGKTMQMIVDRSVATLTRPSREQCVQWIRQTNET